MARQAAEEHLPQHEFSEDVAGYNWRRYLTHADPTIFVADHCGQVIGFATATLSDYSYTDGFFASIDVVYVCPEKRGSRAAALLIQEALALADRTGAREILAGPAVGFRVEQTTRLLQRFGFKPAGRVLRRS